MRLRSFFLHVIWCATGVSLAGAALGARAQVTFGQIDDFQDGTNMGWDEGSASINPPTNEPSGGPAGANDRYLRNVSSGGGGAGSRMVMLNFAVPPSPSSHWDGDYNAAGITRLEAQMANFGETTLHMRVNILGGASFSRYGSTDAAVLEPGGGWQLVVFDLTEMTPQFGAIDSLSEVMGSVNEVRILSVQSPTPTHQGDIMVGTLGMDNLRATTLPGDANFDGRVSFADFQRLELGFGRPAAASAREQWGQGDFNFDGRVDFDDFVILRTAFGSSLPVVEAATVEAFEAAHVPEPAAALLLGAWVMLFCQRRR